jgi:7,8-dihydropterin-6-yl-methyl-4-(beta-D-ribofuranosyl)aminobenzene 5'-phosphate synthase
MKKIISSIYLLLISLSLISCAKPTDSINIKVSPLPNKSATAAWTPTLVPPTATIIPTETKTPQPTETKSIPTSTPDTTGPIRITILYDNTIFDKRLTADWGFSALIEYGPYTILFDTGYNGEILKGNIELLNIDVDSIDIIVLSHEHLDHIGGLDEVLDMGISPKVYIPAAFPDDFKNRFSARTELIEVINPVEMIPGVYSTGQLGSTIVEQGLILATQEGYNMVITGCAHPGIVRMVRESKDVVNGEISYVLGGFHLGGKSYYQVEQIVDQFRDFGVVHISPAHCTGENAITWFKNLYGDKCFEAGAGREFDFEYTPISE